MKVTSWLLLLYSLPTKRNTERVAVWRRLKKAGAVQFKTSTYLLPDEPAQYEQFQWLAQQIRDYGGHSTPPRPPGNQRPPPKEGFSSFPCPPEQEKFSPQKKTPTLT